MLISERSMSSKKKYDQIYNIKLNKKILILGILTKFSIKNRKPQVIVAEIKLYINPVFAVLVKAYIFKGIFDKGNQY